MRGTRIARVLGPVFRVDITLIQGPINELSYWKICREVAFMSTRKHFRKQQLVFSQLSCTEKYIGLLRITNFNY
jgi:hypothetical protein